MDKPVPEFSMNDLLTEIAQELAIAEDGMTTREICQKMGMVGTAAEMSTVYAKIRDLIALGKAEYVGKKKMPSVDGSMRLTPAWRLKQEGGEGE